MDVSTADLSVECIKDGALDLLAHSSDGRICRSAAIVLATMLRRDLYKREISEDVVRLCGEICEAPLKLAKEMMIASGPKKKSKLQDQLDTAMLSLVHLLKSVKLLLPQLAAVDIEIIMSRLWTLWSLQLPQISVFVCDTVKALLPVSTVEQTVQYLRQIAHSVKASERQSVEMAVACADTFFAGFFKILHAQAPVLPLLAEVLPVYISLVPCLALFENVSGLGGMRV